MPMLELANEYQTDLVLSKCLDFIDTMVTSEDQASCDLLVKYVYLLDTFYPKDDKRATETLGKAKTRLNRYYISELKKAEYFASLDVKLINDILTENCMKSEEDLQNVEFLEKCLNKARHEAMIELRDLIQDRIDIRVINIEENSENEDNENDDSENDDNENSEENDQTCTLQ